jgi:hypothetical protein
MTRLFENTVSAICNEVVGERGATAPPAVAAFVLRQWRRMPRFLAWPLWAATIVFAFCGVFSGGLFHRLPQARREAMVNRWRFSPVSTFRDFIRFYRSLAILAAFSTKAG